MVWLFDRRGEQLKYEIRRHDGNNGFLLVTTQADGQKIIEHITEPTELIEKSVVQLRQLRDEGWKIG